jgi:hypothetical protein
VRQVACRGDSGSRSAFRRSARKALLRAETTGGQRLSVQK